MPTSKNAKLTLLPTGLDLNPPVQLPVAPELGQEDQIEIEVERNFFDLRHLVILEFDVSSAHKGPTWKSPQPKGDGLGSKRVELTRFSLIRS